MRREMKILSASGQLGYGIPEEAFRRGVAQQPDVIGADMGSIDPGPYRLGSGEMVVAGEGLRRDLRMVLEAAKETGAPLLMGSAGTAGRRSQLDGVVEVVESIAKERGIRLRLATIAADIPKDVVRKHLQSSFSCICAIRASCAPAATSRTRFLPTCWRPVRSTSSTSTT